METKLTKYIVPNVLAMLGMSCYILADTFFISVAQGANGITALNLVLPLYGLIYALGAMLGVGSATRYSLAKSLESEQADHYFFNSVFFTLCLSIPFVLAGIFAPEQVLRLLGADADIAAVGRGYIQVVLCFAPCFMLNYTFTAFTRNDNAPKTAMAATLISGVFNIIFDYIFMFPMQMGMVGAALATGISPIVSMAVCAGRFVLGKSGLRFALRRPSWRKLCAACSLGVVAFVGEISSGITTLVFNFILLGLGGNIVVAAYGVVANIALVGTSLLNGVSQGLQPLASAAHSTHNENAKRLILRQGLQIAGAIAVAMTALVFLFAPQLVAVFNTEQSQTLADYAQTGLRLYFLGFLIAFINMVCSGFFSATGKGAASSAIALSRGVAAIAAMAFVLSRLWGIPGVWLAFLASELVTLVITVFFLFRFRFSEK